MVKESINFLIGIDPEIKDNNYSDKFTHSLDEIFPVDEVFGEHKKSIASGTWEVIPSLVMDTLGKSKWENHLVSIVMTAAKTGNWLGVVREPGKHIAGLDRVQEKHYGHVVEHEGKKYLIPSLHYVTYCKEKIDSR